MSKLVLVSPEGRVVTNEKPISPPDVELSLDQLAEMEARKQSTKPLTQKAVNE